MHTLFSTHGSSLLPLFDQMLPILTDMLQEDRPSSHKAWSLCMFDDVLDFASQVGVALETC